jgi:hypothetical protein
MFYARQHRRRYGTNIRQVFLIVQILKQKKNKYFFLLAVSVRISD